MHIRLSQKGLILDIVDGDLQLEEKSYKKLCDLIGLNYKFVSKPKQKHTDKVKRIDRAYSPEEIGEVDGLVTSEKNIVLATTNADCILYLIYDKKKRVIANVHSGWRGSYQRIIEKAVDKLIEDYNSNPEDLIVCVCPSIRKCCFEVDSDVKDMFQDRFCFLENINKFILNGFSENKFYIDTVGINNCLLVQKGVRKEHIYDSGICSVCNSDLIHSYRDEGKNYKLATAIIGLD